MQKVKGHFQKVGGYKKAQLLTKKGLSFHIYSIYFLIYQYVALVAFWLRFGCVSYEKNATVAHFFEMVKNGATKATGCGQNATTQNAVYQYVNSIKIVRLRGCAKKTPPAFYRHTFIFSPLKA